MRCDDGAPAGTGTPSCVTPDMKVFRITVQGFVEFCFTNQFYDL